MAQGKITDKQREILEYIKETILKKGYPPAVREICEAVRLKSTSSVHSHLEQLETVSYTHLDVYKRQALPHKTSFLCRQASYPQTYIGQIPAFSDA